MNRAVDSMKRGEVEVFEGEVGMNDVGVGMKRGLGCVRKGWDE